MKLAKWACTALLAASATQAGAVGRLADLSLYDRTEGRRLQVYWHEGRAWVIGRPGNEQDRHFDRAPSGQCPFEGSYSRVQPPSPVVRSFPPSGYHQVRPDASRNRKR